MALMLHPDKNHSVDADGAFKIIQSAFQVLVNLKKEKRTIILLRSKKRPHQPHSPQPTSHATSSSCKSSKATTDQESCNGRCQFQSIYVKTIHQASGTK